MITCIVDSRGRGHTHNGGSGIVYEKLTDRVERVIQIARTFARDRDHEYLGTEHLLLAIVSEGTGMGAAILASAGVDEDSLKQEIGRHIKKSMEDTWVFGRLPGSPHVKSVISRAIEIARQLGSQQIGTEHLLLAMLAEEGSIAEQVLRKLGVSYDKMRDEVSTHGHDE